jgi:hypothetical protein
MNKFIAFFICFLLSEYPVLCQKHTIFGNIGDLKSGEHLLGATVATEGKNAGTFSNNYGFYSLTLPDGPYKILYSFVGYKSKSFNLKLTADTIINIGLELDVTTLGEVIVEDKENNIVHGNQMGSLSLDLKTIRLIPSPVGEADPIKNLQLFIILPMPWDSFQLLILMQ